MDESASAELSRLLDQMHNTRASPARSNDNSNNGPMLKRAHLRNGPPPPVPRRRQHSPAARWEDDETRARVATDRALAKLQEAIGNRNAAARYANNARQMEINLVDDDDSSGPLSIPDEDDDDVRIIPASWEPPQRKQPRAPVKRERSPSPNKPEVKSQPSPYIPPRRRREAAPPSHDSMDDLDMEPMPE